MKISKKSRVTASSTIDSIEFGRTVDVPEAVIQSIVSDIQAHLDTAYPEQQLVCFVDLLTDYRGYKLLRIDTYPADNYELVLRYKIYLHDTTVAHYTERDTVSEADLNIRKDYADTVCDIVTNHINQLRGSTAVPSGDSSVTLTEDYFYDTEKNLKDNGWDDILEWFRSNAWIHNGALIVPAGTKLNWVSEDRYYTTYQVYTPAGTQKIPFLKPEMGGSELV